MTTSSWDALVAKEGVNDPPALKQLKKMLVMLKRYRLCR